MLAGRRPFGGSSHIETMHAILNDSARPLATQPPELQEILDEALAKHPISTTGDFAPDLRRFGSACESGSLPRPGLWASIRRANRMSCSIV